MSSDIIPARSEAEWHRSPTANAMDAVRLWYNVRVGNEQCQGEAEQISVLARRDLFW